MRRGLLGKGALLTVTSEAARTSPVARGKWFLQTFLGVSPPDPPPDVDTAIKEKPVDADRQCEGADDAPDDGSASHESDLRDVPQDLRADGLALENFDAVGAWRTQDERQSRSMPPACWSTARRWTASASLRDVAGALLRSVRARRDREAADLRARPRRRVSGHADGAVDRARRGSQQVQVLVDRAGDREERAVPDEHESSRTSSPKRQQQAAR